MEVVLVGEKVRGGGGVRPNLTICIVLLNKCKFKINPDSGQPALRSIQMKSHSGQQRLAVNPGPTKLCLLSEPCSTE